MNTPKVENMESPRTGNKVANQYIITTDEGITFQSYGTRIVFEPAYIPAMSTRVTLIDPSWDYSVTTLKYFKQFMGWERYSKKEIEKMLKERADIYQVTNLN